MHRHEQKSERVAPSRVLIVDDHRTFTDLVCLALGEEPDLDCVGSAHDAATARDQIATHLPDLVLMDVALGGDDGIDLTTELLRAYPDLRVVILTAHGDAEVLRRAAAAGACALLPKGGSLPELLDALRHAHCGELFVHPRLLRALVVETPSATHRSMLAPQLTPRETVVLQLLNDGRQVSDIARHLGITVHTCRGYVKSLLSKLGAHSQLEAVVVAGKFGLVDASRHT